MVTQKLQIDIQRIKTDQGGEFKSQQFKNYTQEKGILHEFSAAYCSEQNGFIERNNRTIVEAARSMLHSRDLPLSLWAEAASTAVFTWNHTVSSQQSELTPYEQMFNQVPDVSYFRAFDSDAYLHIPKKHRSKLEAKSQKLILVGYDQKGRAYRLWHPQTKRITVVVDVIIHETLSTQTMDNTLVSSTPIFQVDIPLSHTLPVAPIMHADFPTSSDRPSDTLPVLSEDTNHAQVDNIFQDENDYHTVADNDEVHHQGKFASSHHLSLSSVSPSSGSTSTSTSSSQENMINEQHESADDNTLQQPNSNSSSNTHNNGSREIISSPEDNDSSQENKNNEDDVSDSEDLGFKLKPRSRHPPVRYEDWVKYDNNRSNTGSAAYISQSERINEPKMYKEAMQSVHAQQWKEAMTKEHTSLLTNKTWVLKPLPEGRKAVKCKWIYKVKYKPSGEVKRFKARLVAKGFSQVASVDFTDTYAPIVKYDAVRAVFVINNEHGMVKAQFDVCTAYLNVDLLDIIFMEQPEGYQDSQWPLYVCLLLKSLYGLKQSARRWNKTFDKFA